MHKMIINCRINTSLNDIVKKHFLLTDFREVKKLFLTLIHKYTWLTTGPFEKVVDGPGKLLPVYPTLDPIEYQ